MDNSSAHFYCAMKTDVAEEHIASIFRAEEYTEQK
jgi:hypothetical protein